MVSAPYIYKMRVYSEDTDSFGIVHHANYLKFMERARCEWIMSLGHRLDGWVKKGVLFVLHKAEMKYLMPARAYDEIEVVSTVDVTRRVRIVYEQVIRDQHDHDKIYAKGKVTVVCVDKDMRPQLLPKLLLRGMHNG